MFFQNFPLFWLRELVRPGPKLRNYNYRKMDALKLRKFTCTEINKVYWLPMKLLKCTQMVINEKSPVAEVVFCRSSSK